MTLKLKSSLRSKTISLRIYALLFVLCEILYLTYSKSTRLRSRATNRSCTSSRVYPSVPCGSIRFQRVSFTDEIIVEGVIRNIASRTNSCSVPFHMTFVQDPTQRIVDEFFLQMVAREKVDPTDTNIRDFFEKHDHRDYYLRTLALKSHQQETTKHIVKDILQGYDFIGISERLDESLVVMKMLLGLKTEDIRYLIDAGPFMPWYYNQSTVRCNFRGISPFLSPNMTSFINSKEWQQDVIAGDTLLFNAATQSLDRTIISLGQSLVQMELKAFHRVMEEAYQMCQGNVKFPCSAQGNLLPHNDCRHQNIGCGWACLGRLKL